MLAPRYSHVVLPLAVIFLFLVNSIQAIYTPLHGDEAYYWLFSQELNWGYFDHPPLVALWIWLAQWLPQGSFLDIRGMTVLIAALLPLLFWRFLPLSMRTRPQSAMVWIALWLAIPVWHIYGFITTPDVPLLLGLILYAAAYEKYWEKNTWKHGLLWVVTAAFLIYAKYHGGIFIIFSVLVRPPILQRFKTYPLALIGLMLIAPHLYWQYRHEWITFEYHLLKRNGIGFSWYNIGDYIVGALLIINPLWIYFTMRMLPRYRSLPASIRYQMRLFLAILIFFSFYVLRGRVEAHWVAMAIIPMLPVLQFAVMQCSIISTKGLFRIAIISFSLILLVRGAMFTPLSRKVLHAQPDEKEYYQSIQQLAKGRPVIFENSYQNAAKYTYYTGAKSYCRSDVYYHATQFDLRDQPLPLYHKPVLLVGNYPHPAYDTLSWHHQIPIRGVFINSFPNLSSWESHFQILTKNIQSGKMTVIKGQLSYRDSVKRHFQDLPYRYCWKLLFNQNGQRYFLVLPIQISDAAAFKKIPFEIPVKIPANMEPGFYQISMVAQAMGLPPVKISRSKTRTVMDN